MRLEGKVALITGGAAGIGKATAELFAREGATVVICDVSEELGKSVAATLGTKAQFNKVDVTNRAEVQAWVDNVVAKFGRIDILVNNAGITRDAQFIKMKDGELVKQMGEDAFDLVVSVNLKGVFNCAQAVAPYMVKQKGGVILNASSVVGVYGNFGQTNYVATKAGTGMHNGQRKIERRDEFLLQPRPVENCLMRLGWDELTAHDHIGKGHGFILIHNGWSSTPLA